MSDSGRFVHTIWCDDIRQEVGNKPSFMGVFTAGIMFPSLPAALPRLGVYTWIVAPIDLPTKVLQLQIVRDDGLVLAEITPEGPPQAGTAQPRADDVTKQSVLVGVTMGPVEVPAGCKWFVVRVKFDDEEVEGPKLRVIDDPATFAKVAGAAASVELVAPESPIGDS